jgi:uncharacterized damage-inducible protein DinB
MADIGVEAFRHSLWANLRLLDVCASLSENQLEASEPGTYGAVSATLQHMFASEGRYVGEFNGPREPMLSEDDAFPGLEALREHAQASGQALVDIAASGPADRILRGTYRGQPYEMPASILLIHALEHAVQHRTHIVAILTQHGVDAHELRLDGLAYFQAGANA